MALNRSIIMGRLTADPELRSTTTGKAVTSFTVAVDNGKDQTASFIDCLAWGQTAEMLNRYWHKGKLIAADGRLQTRNWEDKNGNKRKATEIVVERIYFCGDKDGGDMSVRDTQAVYGQTEGFVEVDPDGELPF